MRIALYVHCFYPNHIYGTEAYTLTVAKGLKALGHDVSVVTCVFAGEPPQKSFIDRYVWDGIDVISIDKNLFPHTSIQETYDQPALRTIHERILLGLKPDIIHVTHLMNHTVALLEVAELMKIPTVATFTDFFGFCFNNKLESADGELCSGPEKSRANCIECYLKSAASQPWSSPKIKAAANPLLRRVAANLLAAKASSNTKDENYQFFPSHLIKRPDILKAAYATFSGAIAPSTFLRDSYAANGMPTPMRVSHFGIDIDRRPKPVRDPNAPIIIGFVGQIAPHKGVHLLIEALNLSRASNLRLKIWGPEDQDPDYVTKLKELALGSPVEFLGTFSSSKTAEVLSQVDLLCIPSTWYENSPLILLQGLAAHTPVIVSDVAGLTEFVEDGVSGFVFQRGNAKSLADVLNKFAETRELAARMSLETNYQRTTEDMVLDIQSMYGSALSKSHI